MPAQRAVTSHFRFRPRDGDRRTSPPVYELWEAIYTINYCLLTLTYMDDCVLCINYRLRLRKLWNPAIPDERTWSKFGEHGAH